MIQKAGYVVRATYPNDLQDHRTEERYARTFFLESMLEILVPIFEDVPSANLNLVPWRRICIPFSVAQPSVHVSCP